MRCSSFFASLAAVLAASTSVGSAQSPLPTPKFEPLFVGQFIISSSLNATGPFGTRVHFAISGGNLTDAKTGKAVAAILPWNDGHLASIRVNGIGHVETDSPTYSWMNSNFFITRLSATDPTAPVFTIYGVSNSSSSSS